MAETNGSVKRDALNIVVAGKAIERGLDAHIADGQVFVRTPEGTDDDKDHLHRQVLRNLVYRMVPDSTCHIYSTEVGFRVTVELPDKPLPKPEPDWVADLSPEERLDLIRQLVA